MSDDYQPSEHVTVPEGWSCKRLADCTQDGAISYGIVQPGQHDENGVPVIRVNNISNGQLDLSEVLRVSPEIEEKYKRTRLQGGEVLLTLVGSTGQSFVAPIELAGWNVPRAIAVIRVSEEVGADWINICLQSKETMHFLNVRANTTVQKTLNLKDVRDIPILIPPYRVKESIESAALSLSKKIELNNQINQTLEQMAQAIFKSWFVDFEPVKAKIAALEAGGNQDDALLAAMQAIAGETLFANNPTNADAATQLAQLKANHPEQYATLRATAELFPAAMQDSELGEIPEGWSVNKIEDLIQRISVGKRYSQKTVFESGSIPVLDQGKSGIIGYHNDEPGLKASEDDPVIVFANHTCYMRLVMHDFSAIQNVLPFKGKELNIYWIYLATLGKQKFTEYKGHWPDFVIKEVVTPNDIIASHFGSIVKNLFITQFHNEQQSASLSNIRDTLLPKLLSGELSLAAAEEQLADTVEPAHV